MWVSFLGEVYGWPCCGTCSCGIQLWVEGQSQLRGSFHEIKWFTEADTPLASQPRPDGPGFPAVPAEILPYGAHGASCSEHPFQSTFCSQQVFVPGRTASTNTHTPLLTREEALPSQVLWKEGIMERQHSGQFYRALLGIPAQYLARSWHLNWADCTQITLLGNWEPKLIKYSSTEVKSWTISGMTQPVCFPVCKEHSHLCEWPFQTSAGQGVQKMHI